MKKIGNFLPRSKQEILKMKKIALSIILILLLNVLSLNVTFAISEENKFCSLDSDCKITPCGCVNKDQDASCERADVLEPSYNSCKCENDKCKSVRSVNLSNGRKAEIKIMPETASEKAIERLGELGFSITLKEVGQGENAKMVYEVSGEKQGKMLGLFKIKGKVSAEVDAETGEVVKIKRPWWAFMASGI